MPLDTKTKKTIDESHKTKDAAKVAQDGGKAKAMAAPGAGIKKQEEALVPKESKPAKPAEKKESADAKAAKKEAPKKAPPEPEKVAEKATEKQDVPADYWAVREAVSASHNAAKLDETKLTGWIKTCQTLLDKADFSAAVDLRASIERFQEAVELLKLPKGLPGAVVKEFLESCDSAKDAKQDIVRGLIDKGESLTKTASKAQVKDIQGGLEKLYKLGGNQDQ